MIVLNYHGLDAGPDSDRWTLTRAAFDSHLSVLKERLITPADFLRRRHEPSSAKSRQVLVTFDDAMETDYTHAFPRLAALGAGFISFVPTAAVGSKGRMTWPMIGEMRRNGVLIGSHGVDHADLTTLDDAGLRRELDLSKRVLEDRLGEQVATFAFPYGRFNRRVWRAALETGYEHLFTIQLGWHNGFEPFLFSRLCITNDLGADAIRSYVDDPCRGRNLGWQLSSKLGLYRPLMRWRYR